MPFSALTKPFFVLMLLGPLTACGGGGGGGGGNGGSSGNENPPPSNISISTSPRSLEFTVFKATNYDSQTQQVSVNFKGDGVIVGYAPGVTPPSWLNIPQSTMTSPNGQLNFYVHAQPHQETLGTYNTSLRLVTGDVDHGKQTYVDLPVQLAILAPPTVYQGGVTFSAKTTDSGLPAHKIIQLDFGTYDATTFTVALKDENSVASSWLSASPISNGKKVDISIAATKPVGHYSAKLIIQYQLGGATGSAEIPVTLDVSAGAPLVDYVVPNAIYDTEPTDIIVRGAGFDLATVQDVKLGTQSALSFQVVSPTEIRARLPQPSSTGIQPVHVVMSDSSLSTSYSVTVKSHPQTASANLDMGEPIRLARFDLLSDAIIAAGTHNLFRVQLVAGNWQIVNQRSLNINAFDFSPDSRHIVYTDGLRIKVLDAQTLQDVANYALPDILLPTLDTSFQVKEILNNGDVLTTLQGISGPADIYIFQLNNQIFTSPGRKNLSAMTRRTTLRDKVLIAPGNSNQSGLDFNGYYLASTGAFSPQTMPDWIVVSNQFALSNNGSKVLLNNKIYDANLNLLGTLFPPFQYNWSSELSADGSKAYQISAGQGLIRTYDLATPPYATIGSDITFAAYTSQAAFPRTQVIPDGRMMILSGGAISTNLYESRLTLVPLP